MNRLRKIALTSLVLLQSSAFAAGGGPTLTALKLDFGMFILFLITFMVAAFILNKFAFGPILEALDSREGRIADNLDKADKLDRELAELEDHKTSVVAQADAMAKEILAEARKGGNEVKRILEEDGKDEARILRENADREIAAAEEKAREQVTRDSADLAVKLASSILEKELDGKGQAALVDKLIAEL